MTTNLNNKESKHFFQFKLPRRNVNILIIYKNIKYLKICKNFKLRHTYYEYWINILFYFVESYLHYIHLLFDLNVF